MDERCRAIRAARAVVEQYKQGLDGNMGFPIRVIPATRLNSDAPAAVDGGILDVISQMNGLPIDVWRIRGGLGEVLNGFFLRYQDRARIVYSADLNLCYSRFVVCKEAAHVFLGSQENFTQTADEAHNLLTELLNDSSMISSPAHAVETAAYFAAVELILPREFISTITEYRDYGKTDYEIAKSFLVPEKIISFRYDHPVIRQLFDDAYA